MSMRQPDLFGAKPKAERIAGALKAPFPYFGGKSGLAPLVWYAFGEPKQYIEPFCGSLAILLSAPRAAPLEIVGDLNCHIANFWRCVKHQPEETWRWSDYPVSHVDLAARHRWLEDTSRRARLVEHLADPEWPGDAQVAGWWVWGQCCWIGSGWCAGKVPHAGTAGMGLQAHGKVPHAGNAGMGLQAHGRVPHAGNAGMGLQAHGQVPHAGDAGRGLQAHGQVPHAGDAGRGALSPWQRRSREWILALSARLERVRIVHGHWDRCLNSHYGGNDVAYFFDPPYVGYERLYASALPVALDVADWARERADLRIALCGHAGDYDLPGWTVVEWDRGRATYGGSKTTASEAVYFSPACRRVA